MFTVGQKVKILFTDTQSREPNELVGVIVDIDEGLDTGYVVENLNGEDDYYFGNELEAVK